MSTLPDPAPAIPPFEPPPLLASLTESGRRILWIIGVYRAVCGAALFGRRDPDVGARFLDCFTSFAMTRRA